MRICALIACLFLAAFLLPAQSPVPSEKGAAPPPDSTQPTVTIKQEVRNVVVDVVVTDKHGNPITSLDKASFQVLENGVPQEIAFFEHHTASTEQAKTAAHPAAELPPDVHTNISTGPSDGPLIVLLLDAMNTPIQDQAYVRSEIFDYLKQVPAGSHMAIFTLGDQLQLLQRFTGDPAVLKAALDGKSYPTVSTLSPQGLTSSAEGLRLGGVPVAYPSSFATTRASLYRFANEPISMDAEMRIRETLDALNALGIYLAGIPGRKNLIWFSSSVPWTINPDFSLVTSVTGRDDYAQELKNLANVMTAARVSIYPVDAKGLAILPGYGADSAGGARGGTFAGQLMAGQMNIAGVHMSMSNLASATGGRAIYNTNDLAAAVSRVYLLGNNFYTIVYAPKDKKYDGSHRKIEVRLNEPGLKLDYRRGYYADDPAKSTKRSLIVSDNPLSAVMARGAPDATQIPFKVRVVPASRQPEQAETSDRIGEKAVALKGPVVRYDFHWTVDLHDVEFVTTPDGLRHAELDSSLAAYNAEGTVLNDTYATLPLTLDDGEYASLLDKGLPMKQTLDIPVGVVYLRAGVLDPVSGRTGATEFPLAAELKQANAALASPAGSEHQ